MTRILLILACVATAAMVAAAVFASLASGTGSKPKAKAVAVQPCGDRIFGHIKTLVRSGDRYELAFDPAWFTSGVTANTAAAEDGAVPAGQPSRTTTMSSTRPIGR